MQPQRNLNLELKKKEFLKDKIIEIRNLKNLENTKFLGEYKDNVAKQEEVEQKYNRYIRTYLNNSYLPFSYKKPR